MNVKLKPELERRLQAIAQNRSQPLSEVVEEAMLSYLNALESEPSSWVETTRSLLPQVWSTEDFADGILPMVDKAQGQVWWANLPDPLGWRPVLILTRDDAVPKLHYATVAPLTRTIRGLDSEVVLEPDDGVPTRSAVTLDNIATIDKTCWSITSHPSHRIG